MKVVDELEEEKKKKKERRQRRDRERANFATPLHEYADDHELYDSRYSPSSRLQYWEHVRSHPRKPIKPEDQEKESWVAQSRRDNFDIEITYFRLSARRILAFTATNYWDYLTIYFLLLLLILAVMFYDPFLQDYIRIHYNMLVFPPLCMFLCQLVPTVSAVFVCSKYNDLVKLVGRQTFGHWAFNMVLLCQYVEYTYYGGHRRAHKAGKCRIDEEHEKSKMETYIDADGHIQTRKKRSKCFMLLSKCFPFLINKNETVIRIRDESEEGSSTRLSTAQNEQDEDTSVQDSIAQLEGEIGGSVAGESLAGSSVEGSTVLEGMEGGHLRRKEAEKKRLEEEERLKQEEITRRREALIKKWTEWTCMCCGKKNRRPTHPPDEFLYAFSEKGVYYKRTIVSLKLQKHRPRCTHCYTHEGWEPRLCTGHYFKYNPTPHRAFENYPEVVPSIKRGFFRTVYDKSVSCLFGRRNHPDSRVMVNDWRLSIYLSSLFPIIPRPIKDPDDLYEIGEIIECRRQKSDWTRGRIIEARQNHIYDIKYDTGDDVRVVEEHELRLPPGKGAMAYRTELGITLLVLFFPLALAAAIVVSPGFLFAPALLFSAVMICYRLYSFVDTFIEFYSAGCCVIFQQNMIFTLPLLLLLGTSVSGLMKETLGLPWLMVAGLLMVTELFALPVIYIKRPTFAVMIGVLFLESSLTFVMIALRLDGYDFVPYMVIDLFPAFMGVFTLLKFRRWLGFVWDVSMNIRPLEFAYYEPSFIGRLKKKYLRSRVVPEEDSDSSSEEEEEETVEDEKADDNDGNV